MAVEVSSRNPSIANAMKVDPDLNGEGLLVYSQLLDDDSAIESQDESCTWTFYRINTIKGTVVIRWYGSSNGYYSESVSFDRVN